MLHAFLVLILNVNVMAIATYPLDNGKFAFGAGGATSVDNTGVLKQPHYYTYGGSKLTYSTFPMSLVIGFGGSGTNKWNTNGTIVNNTAYTVTAVTLDTSGYSPLNATQGYGTIVYDADVRLTPTVQVHMKNTYTLDQNKQILDVNTKITNISAAAISNVRVWTFIKDDYFHTHDTTTKIRGNLTDPTVDTYIHPNYTNKAKSFVELGDKNSNSNAIKVNTPDSTENIYLYSYDSRIISSVSDNYGVSNFLAESPYAFINSHSDGSYGLYARLNDLAPGQSDSFDWHYGLEYKEDTNDYIDAASTPQTNLSTVKYETKSSLPLSNSIKFLMAITFMILGLYGIRSRNYIA